MIQSSHSASWSVKQLADWWWPAGEVPSTGRAVYMCVLVCVLSSPRSHINHHQSSNCSFSTHTHTHTHTHTVRAEGPLVCVSVKFPWQQIIHSRGMESLCEIQVVCGGLLLLNSHCPFERQAESLSVSPLCSAPRNCETHSLPCYEARAHTHGDTHTLLQKAWRRISQECNRNQIKWTRNRTQAVIGVEKLIIPEFTNITTVSR